MDVAGVVGRARQVVSVMASPALRAAVFGGAPTDDRTRAAIGSFDWVTDDDPDAPVLGRTARELQRLQSAAAVLEFGRIERMPVKDVDRHALSVRIVELVFERLGRDRAMPEAVLNAAVGMFAADVSVVRRDAVDLGVLTRTDDGSVYRFVAGRSA
ncbi:DUF2087 domain-containing protein [Curtobacterium sp. VKM Ac-1393]|uniref:DUF2087 domain-containing protein n=1 Tax=Curtobacterium sp. VKM Ac-1393 TaxID=2783814 RepID=UPI00188CA344|nr:DUF2087 domain-containing protein [Curtobacterium sp. VKM Ac-1393]MBF4607429.1 DUF2087 domain-containing protein [Curtobacterium sp. VKM Ac-1393]